MPVLRVDKLVCAHGSLGVVKQAQTARARAEALQEQLANCDPDLADRVQAQVDGLKVELEAAR
jgi:hypothetical protein